MHLNIQCNLYANEDNHISLNSLIRNRLDSVVGIDSTDSLNARF